MKRGKHTYHIDLSLHEVGDEYHCRSIRKAYPTIKRDEYIPVGNSLLYPADWEPKEAKRYLLKILISEAEKVIDFTQKRLEKLKRCLERVENDEE